MRPRFDSVVVSVRDHRYQPCFSDPVSTRLTSNDDLLRELQSLPAECRYCSSDDVDFDVGGCCCQEVADRVQSRRQGDSLRATEDVEDLGERWFTNGEGDLCKRTLVSTDWPARRSADSRL